MKYIHVNLSHLSAGRIFNCFFFSPTRSTFYISKEDDSIDQYILLTTLNVGSTTLLHPVFINFQ